MVEDGEMVKYPSHPLAEGGVAVPLCGGGGCGVWGRDAVAGITTAGMEMNWEMHPDSSAEGLQMRITAGQHSR